MWFVPPSSTPDALLEIVSSAGNNLFALSATADGNGDVFIVNSSGNVGIGTASPGALLDVFKTGTNQPVAQFGGDQVGDSPTLRLRNGAGRIELFAAGGNDSYMIGTTQGDVGILFSPGDDFFIGQQTAVPDLTILDNGNFGIGDTTPDATLEIVTSGTTDAFNISSTADGDGDLLTITALGLVGIGTTGPDKVLEVNLGTSSALRLTYNDANGSAATFTDFTLASDGGLTIEATGTAGDITIKAEAGNNVILGDSGPLMVLDGGTNHISLGDLVGNINEQILHRFPAETVGSSTFNRMKIHTGAALTDFCWYFFSLHR